MPLSSDRLAAFVDGQIEVQNQGEGYLYRGEIKTAVVEDNEVRVTMTWMAKGDGLPPKRWVVDEKLDYAASLEIYAASEIGQGRLCLNSPIVGETVVFYPPGGSRLDPSKVEGLVL
jgi:hypothetical protein